MVVLTGDRADMLAVGVVVEHRQVERFGRSGHEQSRQLERAGDMRGAGLDSFEGVPTRRRGGPIPQRCGRRTRFRGRRSLVGRVARPGPWVLTTSRTLGRASRVRMLVSTKWLNATRALRLRDLRRRARREPGGCVGNAHSLLAGALRCTTSPGPQASQPGPSSGEPDCGRRSGMRPRRALLGWGVVSGA